MSEAWSIRNSKRWIPIECISFEYYPRENLQEDRIKLFVDLLGANHVFEPVRVARENPDGKLYLIDGRYRIEAYKRIGAEGVAYDLERVEKRFWLLSAARLNTGGPQPLTYGELKKVILATYEAYRVSPQQIHDYLKGLCTLSWIYKVLDHAVKDERERKKKHVLHMSKQGKTFSQIESETGIKRATACRYLKDVGDLEDASTQPGDNGWSQLKNGILKIRDLTIHEEETLLVLYEVKEGIGADEIAKKMDCAQSVVKMTVFCLLFQYHYGSNHPAESITEKFKISEKKVAFIQWLFQRCYRVLPDRQAVFDWIVRNEGSCDYTNKYVVALMRREKLYWQCQSDGIPVPWEDGRRDEDFTDEDLPAKFFETIQNTLRVLNEFKQKSENKRLTRRLVKEIMEVNNKMQILLNLIGSMLRKQM